MLNLPQLNISIKQLWIFIDESTIKKVSKYSCYKEAKKILFKGLTLTKITD